MTSYVVTKEEIEKMVNTSSIQKRREIGELMMCVSLETVMREAWREFFREMLTLYNARVK